MASLVAAATTACIQFLTDNSGVLGFLGMLAVPGYLPEALIFPEGVHSGSPFIFMFLVIAFDGLIYGIPLWFLWRWVDRKRHGSGIRG